MRFGGRDLEAQLRPFAANDAVRLGLCHAEVWIELRQVREIAGAAECSLLEAEIDQATRGASLRRLDVPFCPQRIVVRVEGIEVAWEVWESQVCRRRELDVRAKPLQFRAAPSEPY